MIRIITICLFFFHLIFTTDAQNRMAVIHKLPKSIIECKWENTNNRLELIFYNKDYCPYYVSYSFGRTDFLDPGKNIVYSTNKIVKAETHSKIHGNTVIGGVNFLRNSILIEPMLYPLLMGKSSVGNRI